LKKCSLFEIFPQLLHAYGASKIYIMNMMIVDKWLCLSVSSKICPRRDRICPRSECMSLTSHDLTTHETGLRWMNTVHFIIIDVEKISTATYSMLGSGSGYDIISLSSW